MLKCNKSIYWSH